MSYQPPTPKKSNTGLWLGGAAILFVALIAVLVLLLNRQPAPSAPASAVIVSAASPAAETAAAPTTVDTPAPATTETSTPTSTPMPELGTSNLFIEYILDASGSMSETLPDGSPKIEVAQRVLTEHMRSFRPETNIGLRVYGHRLPYQQTDESCQDIELIAPPEKGQMERIAGWLQDFTVQGMTPLAASLELAKEDFVYDASRINSIVMLSDGIETCGGDPCQLVEDLKVEGINFTIHVIGLDVDDPTRQQLTCIAEAGDGTYHDAKSQDDLNAALGAVKEDVTRDEVVVPPGVNTPTPVLSTPTPTSGISSIMVSDKDNMEMLYVPAGEFLMGSLENQGDNDERPMHTVYLDDFWIDKTEVTNAMFVRFVGETGYQTDAEKGGWVAMYDPSAGTWVDRKDVDWRYPMSMRDGLEDHPVVFVSWNDAIAYCQWAGKRLPTEAEWEKAARGSDGRIYPWGSEPVAGNLLNFADVNLDFKDADRNANDGHQLTAPVLSYPIGASPYGALDMAGNVMEWVEDVYDGSYYAQSPRENPQGPSQGASHVMRGGSWGDPAYYVRVAYRLRGDADFSFDSNGFRCARSP